MAPYLYDFGVIINWYVHSDEITNSDFGGFFYNKIFRELLKVLNNDTEKKTGAKIFLAPVLAAEILCFGASTDFGSSFYINFRFSRREKFREFLN
jgi:hypothetical protein